LSIVQMKRALLALAIGYAPETWACSCSYMDLGPYDRADVQASAWAFHGRVESYRPATWLDAIGLGALGYGWHTTEIVVAVDQVWKGDVPARVVLWTGSGCGIAMYPGSDYVVVSGTALPEGEGYVGQCGDRPWLVPDGHDLSGLGPAHAPTRWGPLVRTSTKARPLVTSGMTLLALLPVLLVLLVRTLRRSAKGEHEADR
jgi:hypothetical protein